MVKLLNYALGFIPAWLQTIWTEAAQNNMRVTGSTVIALSVLTVVTVGGVVYGAYTITPVVLSNKAVASDVSERLETIEAGGYANEIVRLIDWRCKARDNNEYLELTKKIEDAQRKYKQLTGERYFEQRCY